MIPTALAIPASVPLPIDFALGQFPVVLLLAPLAVGAIEIIRAIVSAQRIAGERRPARPQLVPSSQATKEHSLAA